MMKRVHVLFRQAAVAAASMGLALSAVGCSRGTPPPSIPPAIHEATPTATPALLVPAKPPAEPENPEYTLEVTWDGTYSMPGGYVDARYGPDTAVVPLDASGSGSYSGQFHGSVTGRCTATMTYPVAFEVTASPHGSDELDIAVTSSVLTPTTVGSCENLPGAPHVQGVQVPPRSFTLPAEGGTKSYTDGPITWTYTLIKRTS
jgi:hypothetical protein